MARRISLVLGLGLGFGLFALGACGSTSDKLGADDPAATADSLRESRLRHRHHWHEDMGHAAPVETRDMAEARAPESEDMAEPGPVGPPAVADMAAAAVPGSDPFGVREIYPTAPGGREWFLPANADQAAGEWQPSASGIPATVTKVSDGVFNVSGGPRMMVVSPQGKPWWRNVEMTGYVHANALLDVDTSQVPHWAFFARSARHSTDMVSPSSINLGVAAPPGTVTWPGYPFAGLSSVNESCMGSSYQGLLYPNGKVIIQKEISHTEGYNHHDIVDVATPSLVGRWVGFKTIIRNVNADKNVTVEMWMDEQGDGTWQKVDGDTDVGAWVADDTNINGCSAAPFSYSSKQIVTWAGPWVSFRCDDLDYDFKELSVREVSPLP